MFKSIVWANDGSEVAQQALPLVKQLAREGDGAITIVHVVERVEGAGGIGPTRRVDEPQLQRQLERLTAELEQEGFAASLYINGDVGVRPAHEIVATARQRNADLIVVGSQGHTMIGGLLLGSVAYRLLHLAPCPVLVVPPTPK
ncbi:MAG: universal stress protein [Solirubrobacterales bacterium]|nr:universal stress protein [Solirubrobacterales bacterium]MBV9367376.1 universal stress protein [Solirubrobacterales bacterium]MBV9683785.1 universal stress protein [Solirubrobacterales bacterium]MBV9809497.1 universal stress protein [Solirubrobacterales bacterium]